MATKTIIISDITGKPITKAEKPLVIRVCYTASGRTDFTITTLEDDEKQQRRLLKSIKSENNEIALSLSDLASLLGFSTRTDKDMEREQAENSRIYDSMSEGANRSW